jgi:L-ascorbate metabolism protein UlaG (beta-lactamase superfamily)
MKTYFIAIVYLVFCDLTLTYSQKYDNDIQITYVANEGFLLKSSSKKILIDALFSDGYGYFATPSKEVTNDIMNNKVPFDSVDLLFLTHYHKDHCDPKLINDYLKKYPQIKLVTSKPSLIFIDGGQFGFVQLKKQFYEITPGINQSISQTINAIPVKVLGLKHMSLYQNGIDLEEYMYNVGFYFDMDGIKIFHSGDIKIDNLQNYMAKNGKWTDSIDLAFLYYELFNSGQPDLEYILKTLNPKYIIIMHVPPSLNKEWEAKVEKLKASFPNILFFKNTLDSQTLKISKLN